MHQTPTAVPAIGEHSIKNRMAQHNVAKIRHLSLQNAAGADFPRFTLLPGPLSTTEAGRRLFISISGYLLHTPFGYGMR
jgi:hypothetical protein